MIDNLHFPGQPWRTLLETAGWECVVLPRTGPEAPLDAYDVVIQALLLLTAGSLVAKRRQAPAVR